MAIQFQSERVRVPGSLLAFNRLFEARGWSDGLPIIPPTEEAVAEMLSEADWDPQEIIGALPPRWGEATVEKIAINACMAGCLPEYLPVVIAAVEAVADEAFNLYSIQATTHPCSTLIVVNGPIREKLGINSGPNVYGQGWRANATIGRALRLVLLNVGGGIPGRTDKATQGHPGKFTFCIGENEEESPWEPLHVERGFPPEASTVTVSATEGPHNINDHGSIDALGILNTIAGTMATVGSNNARTGGEPLLVLGPEHAYTISEDGFTKEMVKEHMFQHVRLPLSRFSEANQREVVERGDSPDSVVPILGSKEDLVVLVAGGVGKHSSWLPTFGESTRSVTKEIRVKG